MKKLRSVQVLRAVAAVVVCYHHASGSGGYSFGNAGVDLFFVISGFIMAAVAPRRSRAEFVSDRLWRIVPLYAFCAALIMLVQDIDRTACRDVASLTLLPMPCFPYLLPAWTLSLELCFYAMVAVTLASPWPTVASVGIMTGILAWIGVPDAFTFPEFLLGITMAKLPKGHGGLSLTLAIFLWLLPNSGLRFLDFGLPSAALVHAALSAGKTFESASWDGPVLLGDASYSIYLTHFIVLGFLGSDQWPVTVPVMVAVGLVSFMCFERPLLRWHRGRKERNLNWRAEPIAGRI